MRQHFPTAKSLVMFLVLGSVAGGTVSGADDALTLGVFPRRPPPDTLERFQPLASYLSSRLGRPVNVETTHDFASFWESVAERHYDLVHYNQYHYVRSRKEFGYRVILKNEEFGRSTISGTIVARKDSGIESLQDLRGRKVVFGGGPKAMQSYIIATYLLRQAGLREGEYLKQFAFNPPKACIATYYRQAAAAGVGDPVLDLPSVKNSIDVSRMRFLAVSEPLAHLPWAVSADISDELAERIQNALVRLAQDSEGRSILSDAGLTSLNAADDSEYDPHRRIIREVLGEDYMSTSP